MPLISVVIPLYNKEQHIAGAIDSVLSQNVPDFELIVVDDGSTDRGAEVVSSYTDYRIRLIRQDNQGVSAARNIGIHVSKTDFIAFLDADDEWEQDHLETLLRMRNNFPEAGAYTTAYTHIYRDRKARPVKFKTIPVGPWEGLLADYFLSVALGDQPVCSSAVAIPRKVFERVGLFKVGVKRGEDLEMWFRIALLYPIAFSSAGCARYRQDSINRACLQEVDFSSTVGSMLILESLDAYFQKDSKIINKNIVFFYKKVTKRLCRTLLLFRKREESRRLAAKAIKQSYYSLFIEYLLTFMPFAPLLLFVRIRKYFL